MLALTASTLFAGVCAAILQPDVVRDFAADIDGQGTGNVVTRSIEGVWQAMATGFRMDTGVGEVDQPRADPIAQLVAVVARGEGDRDAVGGQVG